MNLRRAVRNVKNHGFLFSMLLPLAACSSSDPENQVSIGTSQTVALKPLLLSDSANYQALQARLCAAVKAGHLTVISDYDRTLVSPDAQHVAVDVGETISLLYQKRKITSFNIVTMRGFGSPVVNEVARFPVYLYAEGGLLFLPPVAETDEKGDPVEEVSTQGWFAKWLREHAETLNRLVTPWTEPARWRIQLPNEQTFIDQYLKQRDNPCQIMSDRFEGLKGLFALYYDEQIASNPWNKETLDKEKSAKMQRVFYSNNVLGCALLHPDEMPPELRSEVNNFLNFVYSSIQNDFDNQSLLSVNHFTLQKIHDGIALNVTIPHKGTATEEILRGDGVWLDPSSSGSNACGDAAPVAIVFGDDVNDHKMFEKVDELGPRGISVIVGDTKPWEEGISGRIADYRATGENQVHELLKNILSCDGTVVPVSRSKRMPLSNPLRRLAFDPTASRFNLTLFHNLDFRRTAGLFRRLSSIVARRCRFGGRYRDGRRFRWYRPRQCAS